VTRYPAKKAILFHNEGSHTPRAPRFIFFHCALPATRDGETPLADSSAVFHALPPEMRRAFLERGLLYRRNFLPGLDVSWQDYFHTDRRDEVERLCAEAGTCARWHADGNLETETLRPAVIPHPDRGIPVFFNQILLHHPYCLDPEVRAAIANMPLSGRFPRDVRFGDGAAIPDEWVAEVLRAHAANALCFRWQPGDIVMVDNQRTAHARRPYAGARQHHVVLAD
jgi:alpha-ketoglutarate-dependent taurine dioxygenase